MPVLLCHRFGSCLVRSKHFWRILQKRLPGAPGRCSGGVRVSPGRRSSGYGLLCRPLLPFSRRRARVLIGWTLSEFCKSPLWYWLPKYRAWFSRSDHIRSIRSGPHRLEGCESCTGRAAAPFPLGAETSRAGRLEGVRVFSGTAGTCRVRVRNPGALRGRLGAGVVAYVPRYDAYVTLSRAPRETALFPVHCCHSSLPGRYASAAYSPAGGGTTGNMACIPGGRGFPGCCAMLRAGFVALRRFGVSVWFALVRHASLRGDTPYWLTMARYDIPGVRRYASVYVGSGSPVWLVMVRFAGVGVRRFASPSPAGGGTGPDMARILPGPGREIPDRLGSLSRYVALCRAACQGDPGVCGSFFQSIGLHPGRVGPNRGRLGLR